MGGGGEGERETERDGERETERERERQRQGDRERETERPRETERDKERETEGEGVGVGEKKYTIPELSLLLMSGRLGWLRIARARFSLPVKQSYILSQTTTNICGIQLHLIITMT